ncbi:MAG: hypothetical protein J6K55_14110 [Clostridia bacterium]|nr:hypothetical protein [Clostridia bacterium]
MDGFRFAGIHSSTLGCYYHPDAKARGDVMEEYDVEELTSEGRDGGYYIGARVNSKTFE